ncbi:MAG: amino acid ABC transporter ATP-binding protein [Bacilli bacterium]|jgi:polar amino acid transport system ATP-binding protein|nr:amino acid ABC transporter ATP-binding protein [Bacilli bacterium]MCH4210469.1 amino acid ABC transporter ATP-binding protein [Bacilli bacterium]MCH4228356.1 amino acid ABC transporter ATP-binding protein [Bacilli bacterium]MCH4277642.1 amino acid ABC transporter ATP-binding protein [Bacilli bacterium]MCI2054828.1 amino acid ABC transporter ATP-binding protein [Bacilli bacterium]
MLELSNVSVIFDKEKILDDVSLKIEKGEVLAIIGPSGSGKSTLIKTMNGLVKPSEGHVYFDGVEMNDKNAPSIRKKETMVFQQFELFPHLDVLQNITLAPVCLKMMDKKSAEKKALELLRQVGLEDKAHEMPNTLSGGQKQRVAIARSLAMDPEMVLFDEPTSALDPEMVGEVLDVIGKLASKGLTLAIVTHEMNFAEKIATRVIFVDDHRIIEDGTPDEIFHHPKEKRIQDFLAKVSLK